MSWERMPGGDKVRYCSGCRLNVYNLAEMDSREVAALFRKGRVCGRLYMRGDRTATLRDCRQGRARRNVRRALTAVAVLLLGVFGWLLRIPGDRDRSVHPRWVREAIEWIGPQQPTPVGGDFLIGIVCPANPPSGTPQ